MDASGPNEPIGMDTSGSDGPEGVNFGWDDGVVHEGSYESQENSDGNEAAGNEQTGDEEARDEIGGNEAYGNEATIVDSVDEKEADSMGLCSREETIVTPWKMG
ncbi:hypothetical protein V6N13_068211 [Hibiscus sabdariffa]